VMVCIVFISSYRGEVEPLTLTLSPKGRGDGLLPLPFGERAGVRGQLPALTQHVFLICPHVVQPLAARRRIVTLAVHLPYRLPRQGFLLFQQRQARGVVAVFFQLFQGGDRLQQRAQQGFLHVAGADNPRRDAVDGGV